MEKLTPIEIDGQKGLMAYLDKNFELTNEENAVMAKIVFEEGFTAFYYLTPKQEQKS